MRDLNNIYLNYNRYDIFNTQISKIKVIKADSTNIEVYNYIKSSIKKFGITAHPKFQNLYLNEHCNISILGSDLKEYIFDTNKSEMVNLNTRNACPLLTNTCSVNIIKKEGKENIYDIQVLGNKVCPNNPEERRLCENIKVNQLKECFENNIVESFSNENDTCKTCREVPSSIPGIIDLTQKYYSPRAFSWTIFNSFKR